MKMILIAYVATLVVFAAIDFIWLSTMADVLYKPIMGDMLAPEFRLAPAVVFYLIFAAGLAFFAVRPALQSQDILIALFYGAAVGLVAYATYDLTNQATLKNWSTVLTIADLAWGTTLSAVASASAYWITMRLAP
jgi:uncharacterized membrane protein